MEMRQRVSHLRVSCVAAGFVSSLLLGAASLSADVIYNVALPTTSYSGQTGYLDFQVGRGPDSQAATATISNLGGNGSLITGNLQTAGAVTGTLPSAVTIANTTQFNDYFEGYTFGSALSFTVTLSGPAINAPNGTSLYGTPFVFGIYGANQSPLGPNDGAGNALLIEVNTNGSTTPTIYNPALTLNGAPSVPEPGTLGLWVAAALASAMVGRRRATRRS